MATQQLDTNKEKLIPLDVTGNSVEVELEIPAEEAEVEVKESRVKEIKEEVKEEEVSREKEEVKVEEVKVIPVVVVLSVIAPLRVVTVGGIT